MIDLLRLVVVCAVLLTVSVALLAAVIEGALVVVAVPRRGLRWSVLNAGLGLLWLALVALTLGGAGVSRPVAFSVLVLTSLVVFVVLAKVLHQASMGRAILVVLTSAFLAFVLVMGMLRVGAYLE